MLPVKKTSFQTKEKTTETKSIANNPIQIGNGGIQEKTPPKRTSMITSQPILLDAGLPSGADLGEDSILTHVDQRLLPNPTPEPSQEVDVRQDPFRATSSAPSSSDWTEYKKLSTGIYQNITEPEIPSSTTLSLISEVDLYKSDASKNKRLSKSPQEITGELVKLRDNNTSFQTNIILQEILDAIPNLKRTDSLFSEESIDTILDCIDALCSHPKIWTILLALQPHITENITNLDYVISQERINNILNSLSKLKSYRMKWEIILSLITHIQFHIENDLQYCTHLGNIVKAFQALKAVAYLGESEEKNIEAVVKILLEQIQRHSQRKEYLDVRRLALIAYNLNGTSNPEGSAIELLLTEISTQIDKLKTTAPK